jgi:hypothetical protein
VPAVKRGSIPYFLYSLAEKHKWARLFGCQLGVDVSYAAPQSHGIVNVALHREYFPGIVFIFFPREEGSLSCIRLTQ